MIPVMKPYMGIEEYEAIKPVIESGWVTQGKKVEEFEKLFADYVGAKYAIAVNSCTSALHISLLALGIGRGDEVIIPSYTYIATANSVVHAGATPVFVDIDRSTYNIDPKKISEVITKKTKAIMPVHQVGLSADLDEINGICEENNLFLVDDAACALGSEYNDQRIGSLTRATSFSFHPRKSITTGEGGMLTTNEESIANLARQFRFHGASVSSDKRHSASTVVIEDFPVIGYNYKMTDIQAALGIEQLKKADFILNKRREVALRYNDLFSSCENIDVPFVPSYAKHSYQSYIIRVRSKKSQVEIMEELLKKGVATRRGIMAIHDSEIYKKIYTYNLPVTEDAVRNTLIIPLYVGLTDKEQDLVVKSIKEVL